MKQVGETVQVTGLRPGERMYGLTMTIKIRAPHVMVLETTNKPKAVVEIITRKGELHDDPLLGPPQVEVLSVISDIDGGMRRDSYKACFYELGDYILLILI